MLKLWQVVTQHYQLLNMPAAAFTASKVLFLTMNLFCVSAEESLEEIKKLLLLMLGCAVQVNADSMIICAQKKWRAHREVI